jgi:hypothetical protein
MHRLRSVVAENRAVRLRASSKGTDFMRNATGLVFVMCALVVGGCGDDRRRVAPDGGGTTPDAGSPRDSGSEIDAGDLGGPDDGSVGVDAGAPIDGFPDVPRMHVGHSDFNLLTLVSHNLIQNPTTGFQELLLVVRNDNPTLTFCSVISRFEFFDASGTSITWLTATFDGEPRRAFGVEANCIPPGVVGLGYANASSSLPVDDVARIDYYFNGAGSTAADNVNIATVTDEGRTIVDAYGGGTYWALRGTLRVVSGSIHNPDVTVFPIDGRGLPYDSLGDIELLDVYAGSSWPYETTAAESRFTDYLIAHSYRGTGAPVLIDSPQTRAALGQRDRYEALRNEQRVRRVRRP